MTYETLGQLMTTQDERHNAEGYYSHLGDSITMRMDLDMLSKDQQMSMLNRLLTKSGSFTAMRKAIGEEAFKAACEGINKAWEEYRKV